VHCVVSVYWKLIQSRNKFFIYANILDNKTFSDSEDHFGQAGEPVNNLSPFKVFLWFLKSYHVISPCACSVRIQNVLI